MLKGAVYDPHYLNRYHGALLGLSEETLETTNNHAYTSKLIQGKQIMIKYLQCQDCWKHYI